MSWNTLWLLLALAALPAAAQEHQHTHLQHQDGPAPQAPVFAASTGQPFARLMDQAMAVMDDGMAKAPMNGAPDHDFITMMMPHHQGAIDMARSVLLYTQDPEIRNLALGIIAEQQNEIKVMQAWLQRQQKGNSK
ncbi:DUF305 domain-containing protein [Oxalobacteraceae bacterium A2-2]